ncbi:MAG: multidrug efflux SMR transporter [Cyanobacteriota bacterium]|nr:multidrug efflux SMR transporter [Cyanobacteriota bacterium]
MDWVYLAISILAEVAATSALKATQGFTRPQALLLVVAGYSLAFFCLSLTLRTIPLSVAYALWSGVGLVLLALVGRFVYDQRLDRPAMLGLSLILAGIVILNLFSNSLDH